MTVLFKRKDVKPTVKKLLKKEDYYPPKVRIELTALLKMKEYVENCENEIAWLCLVRNNGSSYDIYDTIMCKQNVSSVTAELHESGLQEVAERLMSQNRGDELANVRGWGHSHVNMEVRASGQDDETFEEYYKDCEYFLRLILNKKGDMCIDIAEPERDLVFYNVTWEVIYPNEMQGLYNDITAQKKSIENKEKKLEDAVSKLSEEIKKNAKSEIEKYVTKEKYSYYNKGKWDKYDYGTRRYGWEYDNEDLHKLTTDDQYDDWDYDEWLNDYDNYTYKSYEEQDDNEGYVEVFKGTQQYAIWHVSECMSLLEMTKAANMDLDELKESYADKRWAIGYKDGDWTNLMFAITAYLDGRE